MDNFEWYVKLVNFLDKKAKDGVLLTQTEIDQLNICIKRYCLADTTRQLILDIADANDCGICVTWNELIIELRKLHETGKRVSIKENDNI